MRRAFRVDKTTLAALDVVLGLYLQAEDRPEVPTLDLLAATPADLTARAEELLADLRPDAPDGWSGQVATGRATVGGGAFSNSEIESRLVQWHGPKEELEACHRLLRQGDPALVGRMGQEGLGLDLRTLQAAEVPLAATAMRRAWRLLTGSVEPGGGSDGS
jgi:L-seryl-tRNA(Ser) seleniumtransferase